AIRTYTYNLAGQQVLDTSTVTGGGATTQTINALNLMGRAVQQRTPSDSAGSGSSAAITYVQYDRWGNVTSMTDASGNVTSYAYDAQNQLIQQTEANVLVVSATGTRSWGTPTKSWYYNVKGQLIGGVDENGNASWNTYDAAGHLTVAQDATGAKTTTAYDALGRAVAQQLPSVNTAGGLGVTVQSRITYTSYNNLNQVTAQGDFLLDSAGTARTQQAQETY